MKKKYLLAAAVMLVMCSCGRLDSEKIKGTWTLARVNGVAAVQFAAVMGMEMYEVSMNCTFYEDCAVIEDYGGVSEELSLEWQENGVIVQKTDVFLYNEESDILTIDYGEYVYTFTRGEFDFAVN